MAADTGKPCHGTKREVRREQRILPDETHRSKPSQDGGMISAGCCPVDMKTNTTVAIIPLGGGLPVHFPRLSVPTPLELTPSAGPAGSRVILNRQGFLSPSVGRLTTINPARNLTAPAFSPYSECLEETNPRLPGTSSIVWFADRDGNSFEQLALPIESSGPPLFSRGVTDMVQPAVSVEGAPSSVLFMGLRSIRQIHFVVPESANSPSNVTINCHDSSVFQQQVETGGAITCTQTYS